MASAQVGPDHIGVELVLGELLLPDIPRGGPVTRPTEHLYPGHLLHLGGDEDGDAAENDEVYDNKNKDTCADTENGKAEHNDTSKADDSDDKESDEDMLRL